MTDIRAAQPESKAIPPLDAKQVQIVTSHAMWPKVEKSESSKAEFKAMGELKLSVDFMRQRSVKEDHLRRYFMLLKEMYLGSAAEVLNGVHKYMMVPGTWVISENCNGASAELFGYHETVQDAPLLLERNTSVESMASFMSQKQREIMMATFLNDIVGAKDPESLRFIDEPIVTSDSLTSDSDGERTFYLYLARNATGEVMAFALVADGFYTDLENEDYELPPSVASTVMKHVAPPPVALPVDPKLEQVMIKTYADSVTWLGSIHSIMVADLKAREMKAKTQYTPDELKIAISNFAQVEERMKNVYTYLGGATPSEMTLRVVISPREESTEWSYDIYLNVPPNIVPKVQWTVDHFYTLRRRFEFSYRSTYEDKEKLSKAKEEFQKFSLDLQGDAMGTFDIGTMVRLELSPQKFPFKQRSKYNFVEACVNAYDRLH